MAKRPDYYAVLGVERDASSLAIRAAYRRLVLRHHPDRHPGDAEATRRLSNLVEAYETLGDEKRRKTYDDGSVVLVEEATGWEEILGRVVDAFVSPLDTRSVAGRDHQYQLSLSLKEAARGCTKSLSLPRQTRCDVCEGRGFPLEVFPSVCSQCQGAGAIEERRSLRRVVIACEGCAGRGYCLSEPCVGCAGQGRVPLRQEVSIDIPAGVVDGATLVVRGAGQAGTMGGASGDCFVKVQVQPDPVLSIVGSHVTMTRTITALQAMRGDWVVVPTLDGASRLRVPRNALSGSVLRMPGFGVGPEGSRGDQLVTLDVELPQVLSSTALAALETLAKEMGEEAFPKTARFEADHVGPVDGTMSLIEDTSSDE